MSKPHRRILALDVHPRRAGFALLESSHCLVDWGTLYLRDRKTPSPQLVLSLIERTRPARIVIVTPANQTLARRRLKVTVGVITAAARARRVRVIVFTRHGALRALGVSRRHAAAVLVAEQFPALKLRLPRPRRTQDNAHPAMCLFDAAAAGLAYFEKYKRRPRSSPAPPRAA